jgi:proline iminopeptidase
MPGDEVIAHPMVEWTRATTIAARPEQVWPWLVQMGYGRGGWYTNEWVDRLVWRVDNPGSDVILAEWQQLATGDVVPDGPDCAAYFRVRDVHENEFIVYHSIRHPYRGQPVDAADEGELGRREASLIAGGLYLDFSWAFVLEPTPDGATRLLVRTRANVSPGWVRYTEPLLGLVDLFHVETMFRGIRRRVIASRR